MWKKGGRKYKKVKKFEQRNESIENNNAKKAAVDIHTHTHTTPFQRKSLLLFMKRNFVPDVLGNKRQLLPSIHQAVRFDQRCDW